MLKIDLLLTFLYFFLFGSFWSNKNFSNTTIKFVMLLIALFGFVMVLKEYGYIKI